MKRVIFTLLSLICFTISQAQIVTLVDEAFENPLSGWTITPSAYWEADTNLYAGGHASYHGYVPIGNQGDTVVLTSPLYDFSGYGYAYLMFSQICKVASSDMCRIEYRENTMSSTWKPIPTSSYKGEGKYINAQFNHSSYLDWRPDDSLALPTQAWWKSEQFDISDEVSFTQVQFRFIITKGSVTGTHFANGWLIDNFKLTASVNPIIPPVVELITHYGDTVYNTGPFEIRAKVASRTYAPILTPTLHYAATFNSVTTNDSITMTAVEGDSIWTATIPQFVFGTSIVYYINGYDSVGNTNSANGGFYIKRGMGGSVADSVIIGMSGGTNNFWHPFCVNAEYSWSRSLYMATDLGTTFVGQYITRFGWYNNYNNFSQNYVYTRDLKIYMKATNDISVTLASYIQPITDGATLVYDGQLTTSLYWNTVNLQIPFFLPPNQNLLVYVEDSTGIWVSPYIIWTQMSTSYASTVRGHTNLGGSSNQPGHITSQIPITLFGFGVPVDDTNSVALHSINNPGKNVFVDPMSQTPVIFTIKNNGIVDLDSCYIDWTLNGVPQPRFTWRGHLPSDFNASDTIGYYTPKANQYDTIVMWTSLPNGVYDSTTYDDTIIRIAYGISGLDMEFLTYYGDTVYNTGPFPMQARIATLTPTPLPSLINLNVKYTYNGIDSYDTLPMTALGNNIYEAIIPQHVFGTNVEYSITLIDSLGNICTITDGFYVKRMAGGSSTGYVIVGTGTNTQTYAPFYKWYDYSWSRMLYLASELNPTSGWGMITKLAWHVSTTGTSANNQTCYFKEVTDIDISNSTYVDPLTSGATLVWSGTFNPSSTGWIEITLDNSFILTPNKNLLIFWENRDGNYASPYADWTSTSTSPTYMTVYDYQDGSFPTSSGSLQYDRPNARFYLIGNEEDSNSVALLSIDNPQKTILVNPFVQVPVVFTIKNKGIADLDSCYIDWTVNGIPQPRFTWRGKLPADFNASDTIGYYTPVANQWDTIVIWTSSPNGVYDSTTYDDTIIRISYGISGLDLAFVSSIDDTVYITGPFTVQARIVSRTLAPLPSAINLNVKYTYNGTDTYDTLPLTLIGNGIYEAVIPQHVFGTDVEYSITLIDSLGNVCSIVDYFYIKRPGAGMTGYVIVGTGTSTAYMLPMDMYYNYSWTRQLYHADELSPASTGGLITKLAWQYAYGTPYTYANQSCYFKAVDDLTISSTAYQDPVAAGATLVWSGTINLSMGWCEIDLATTFLLPSGKNLLIYWHHNNGTYAGSSYVFNYTTTANYQAVYCHSDGSFPSGSSGTLTYNRPNARFYLVGSSSDSNSVALLSIDNPTDGSPVGINPVKVTIKNKGMKPIDSCVINWTVNGVLQTPYIYRGHILDDFNDTVTIGYYTQRSNQYDTLVVWVGMPNGVIDTTTWDDTLSVISFGCLGVLSGDLIVGTSPGADVPSISDALFVLSKCGTNGNVTLKLQSGTYVENWDFTDLANIMGSDTLTITSLNGNRNSVVLKPASGVGIVFNNTENFIVKDISIDNTSSSAYGVQFTGVSNNNIEIRNINFICDTVGTSSTNTPIYKTSTGVVNDIRIIGNTIKGGYYGIYFYGGTSTSAYGTNIVVDSNIIESQYYYANYFYYTDFKSFSHNTILSRLTNTSTYWYGFHFYYCNFIADGNKVLQRSTGITYPYLTYIYYAGYYNAAGPSLFCNNELIGSSTSTYYGMYLGSYNQLNIYNNSIYMSGSGASRNIYTTNTSTSVYDIKNNIIVNASTGYPIYVAGTSTIFTSDYNCLYGNSYVGYLSSAHSTLVAWQTATTQDANSISVNPPFIDVNNSLEMSDYSAFFVPRLSEVPNDINDIGRSKLTMMGAYSVPLFEGYDLKMESILSQEEVNDIHCYSDFTNIQVVLKNIGTEHYYFNTDAIKLTVEVSGAIQFKKDTLINIGLLKAAIKDTFEITNVLPVTTPGIYDIITYVSSVLDTVYNDDTLRTSYGIHKIQLPYETDFSLSPAEILMKQVIGTATWEVESDTGDNPAIAPVYGTGRLTFHSESGAGSIARAIFNGINLLGTHQPKLEFWYAHDNSYPTKRDFVAIKISTDGINTQLLDAVYRYDQTYTSPGWAYYTIDLSAYVNEPCVSLIFEGNSFGGANQNIDRIRISSSQDISLTYLSPKVNNLVACNLDNQTVRVIVSNLTSQRVDFNQDKTDIHFYVSGADTVAYVYPLSGILAGLASDTVEITHQLNLSRSGIYDITAYLNAIDGNTSNDTTKNSLFINPDLSIQDIVGVDETNCKQIGDSVYVSFKIVNIGNLPVDEIPLSLQINGVNKLNDTLYKRLDPGDYINYSFTKPYVVPEVSDVQPYYYVKIKTDMPCDALTSNNIKEILACVDVVKVVDIKVSKINHPVENPCDTGLRPVNVSVTLSNEGNVDIEKTVLHVEVDSSGQPHASFSETTNGISAKSTITHIFTQSYLVPNQSGNYKLKVYVENVSDDNNPDNDSLEINPCAIKEVGVADYEASKWSMGQNIPNPAKGSVDIPFSIPQAGNLQFTIRSISGQILYTRNIQGVEGINMFTCDITAFADGIYYYSMEYQGQRMTKKITILH